MKTNSRQQTGFFSKHQSGAGSKSQSKQPSKHQSKQPSKSQSKMPSQNQTRQNTQNNQSKQPSKHQTRQNTEHGQPGMLDLKNFNEQDRANVQDFIQLTESVSKFYQRDVREARMKSTQFKQYKEILTYKEFIQRSKVDVDDKILLFRNNQGLMNKDPGKERYEFWCGILGLLRMDEYSAKYQKYRKRVDRMKFYEAELDLIGKDLQILMMEYGERDKELTNKYCILMVII